ncbi:GNAT family N-acetyltransferase [Actinophytocola oryzae]|uniref:Acetyltransferase (GNAT) family protein n=1 Tax=Actinophytocola oryzae TaxID=502181 RepID=A0A4R7V740_9PSEU|nr:GNAT family N-acetyltransferase [Actinophytocola oryzae]TDV44860.1 acetyltransferase (GNAT) family protein [Actinophytocola oryzae]
MEVIRLTGDDWRTLCEVRLAALADAPHAYGSTLAGEAASDEADWRRRLDTALWVVAVHAGGPAGLAGLYLSEPDTPMLISVWVSPDHRGLGVGDALVTEVFRWAKENRWSSVVLRVADGNDAARGLFLRHGFAPTGRREPLESDPGVLTEMLVRAL